MITPVCRTTLHESNLQQKSSWWSGLPGSTEEICCRATKMRASGDTPEATAASRGQQKTGLSREEAPHKEE